MRSALCTAIGAALLVAAPGGSSLYAEGQTTVRVSTMLPRTPSVALEEKKFNKRLAEATGGKVKFRTYYGGAAGDDKTVMRKMRTGQIDAAPMGVQLVSRAVPQSLIMMAPQTFTNYKQIDAVRAALDEEFGVTALKNGFKVMSWWDAGKVRIFSKKPVRNFKDLQTGRPWLYPEEPLLKAFYKMVHVTGVPLDLNEVYAGLSTNMIDTVWISAVLAGAFRWSSKTEYVSKRPVNIIQGAFIMRAKTWNGFSKETQGVIAGLQDEAVARQQKRFRRSDESAYKKLFKRGFKGVDFENDEVWDAAGRKLRDKMVGRIYDRKLLKRVEGIAAKYKGKDF